MSQARLKTFFETIDTEVSLEDFKNIYANEVHFIDPLCELDNVEAVYNFFQHIYQKVDIPLLFISEYLSEKDIAYVRWRLDFSLQDKPEKRSFVGISRFVFDSQGKIIEHTNYWDTAEHLYETIPLLGNIIRWIKKRIIS